MFQKGADNNHCITYKEFSLYHKNFCRAIEQSAYREYILVVSETKISTRPVPAHHTGKDPVTVILCNHFLMTRKRSPILCMYAHSVIVGEHASVQIYRYVSDHVTWFILNLWVNVMYI